MSATMIARRLDDGGSLCLGLLGIINVLAIFGALLRRGGWDL